MKVITLQDIEKGCGTQRPTHIQTRKYLLEQWEQDNDLVLHIGEERAKDIARRRTNLYTHISICNEVWIIRQIGPAKCIKHRYKATPFEQLF